MASEEARSVPGAADVISGSLQPCLAAALLGPMGGSTPHGQHNKSHKTGKHQAKGQRHKQREAKGAPTTPCCREHASAGAFCFTRLVMRTPT